MNGIKIIKQLHEKNYFKKYLGKINIVDLKKINRN